MYAKIFASMFTGSMHGAGCHVFAVWSYALAWCGREGCVDINPKALSPILGCSVQDVESALEYLQRPDPESRTATEDGRRLVREGRFQFRIVNYAKYSVIVSREAKLEADRERIRAKREKRDMSQVSHPVASCRNPSRNGALKMETETEDKNTKCSGVPPGELTAKGNVSPISSADDPAFESFWTNYPSKVGKGAALKAWKKLPATDRKLALGAVIVFGESWRGADVERSQFIPHPSTWLNQARWTDDPAEWRKSAGHPNGNGNGKPAGPSPDLVERRAAWQGKHDAMWDAYEIASLEKDPAAASLKKAWEDDLATYPK